MSQKPSDRLETEARLRQTADFGSHLVAHGHSDHTVRNYCRDVDAFFQFAVGAGIVRVRKSEVPGHIVEANPDSLRELAPENIAAFVRSLFRAGLSNRTVERRLAALRTFFRYLCRVEEMSDNPAQIVPGPKVVKNPPVFLTVDEAKTLVESAGEKRTFFELRDRAILELHYSTGIRVSELCSLSLLDLDLRSGQMRVKGKGKKERLVPFGNMALESLRNYLGVRATPSAKYKGPKHKNEAAVFLNREGSRLSTRSVNKLVHKYVAKSGIMKEIGPHKLRHTCATHLYSAGMELRHLQELLGHKNISTTSIYTHTNIDRLKRVHKKAHPRA